MLYDLMASDDPTVEKVRVGTCPACGCDRDLFKVTAHKRIFLMCSECFYSGMKITEMKSNYKEGK
jgi:hypothetical protein